MLVARSFSPKKYKDRLRIATVCCGHFAKEKAGRKRKGLRQGGAKTQKDGFCRPKAIGYINTSEKVLIKQYLATFVIYDCKVAIKFCENIFNSIESWRIRLVKPITKPS